MAKFVDYDPDRDVTMMEDSYDGKLQLHYQQDVEPLLERTKMMRNDGLTDSGIKRDIWKYAEIPPVIILEMKFKYGVDIFDRNDLKKAFHLINTVYPYFKTTEKYHEIKH